jgi:hypothetical protein
MSQIFSRKSHLFITFSLIALPILGISTGVLLTLMKWSTWQTEVEIPVNQPVPFSHQHHVSGLGLDCRYCHSSVTKAAYAGMPPTHTCMTCHSQIWTNAPMLKPVRDSFAQGKPLEWNRVYRLPKYVYFNHRIHVNQGIGCTSCHGQVQNMPLTWKAKPFYMKDCLACHRNPESHIRPREEVFNPNWIPPKNQTELGSKLVKKYHIPKERLTDCYTCHR